MASARPVDVTADDIVLAAGLVTLGTFQVALAAGAPWAEASYGGAHQGTLPVRLRTVSGVAACGYAALAAAVLGGAGSARTQRRLRVGLAAWLTLGTVANLASRSKVERVWAPVCAVGAVAAVRSA